MAQYCINYLKKGFEAKELKKNIGKLEISILYGRDIIGFHIFLYKAS